MAKTKETPAGIGNGEILAEIKLIDLIQRIETKLVIQPNTIRFAELADAYVGIGNYDEAIRLCTEGIAHYPNYGPARLVLARAHYRSGNKAKAQEILEQYLTVSPANVSAHKLLGDISLEGDDIKSAVNRYRTALRMDPVNREVIQQLIDLKDAFQKVKDGGDDDEPADAKPLVLEKKTPAAPVVSKKPEPKETATPVQAEAKKDHEADLLIRHDLIDLAAKSKTEQDTSSSEEPADVKPVEEPVAQPAVSKKAEPPVVKPAAAEELGNLVPSFTDTQGKYYFCVDDELSFPDYKKRKTLIDAGKAALLSRAEIDALIEKASPGKTTDSEITFKHTPETIPSPLKSKSEKLPSFEESAVSSMSDESMSVDEQEAALDELEISYKDYLDILTDESLLMEALFTDEEPYGTMEDEGLSLVSKLAGEAAEAPISYRDYVASLTSESDRNDARLDGEDAEMSLAEFTAAEADEPVDFHTFLQTASDASDIQASLAGEEPAISYADYLSAIPDSLKQEASFETPAAAKAPEPKVEKAAPLPTPPKTVVQPPASVKEVPTPKVEAVIPKPVEPAAADEELEEVEEEIVDETEEVETTEINPNDASLELVESYVASGQFGTAYKVCKLLKQKNPSDAKIDRKMLELKRLYLWSTQLAG